MIRVSSSSSTLYGVVASLLLGTLMLFSSTSVVAQTPAVKDFSQASGGAQQKLEESLKRLADLRAQMAEEMVPLSKELTALEEELRAVRQKYQETSRLLDSRTLDLTNLRNEIKTREQETGYLSNLMSEYIRNFESRIHIVELQKYEKDLETAKLAAENTALTEEQIFQAQSQILSVSLDRLEKLLGGLVYEGRAVDANGTIKMGEIILVGPTALFVSEDGLRVGTAEQRLGSLEPTIVDFKDDNLIAATKAFAENNSGMIPVDPTLGSAHKVEETKETLVEHIGKGGPVMVPILGIAFLALLVGAFKWTTYLLVRNPSKSDLQELMAEIAKGNAEQAKAITKRMNQNRPDFLNDWPMGALVGFFVGAGLHLLLSMDLGFNVPPAVVSFVKANTVLSFGIIGAIALGAMQFVLRLILGYSPVAMMLGAAVEHLEYPSELIEEVMYEKILAVKHRLESLLPLISITASAAPLLGLLGTVTGIINTFKLITVFGSGDVKTLSGGISEALITTEYGLIVAIPALILHAFLSRRAKGMINQMETVGVELVNQLSKRNSTSTATNPEPAPVSAAAAPAGA
ncbi:MAG: MotA/TolQ/ExbB proton channel family protein [Candidatus Sumerlaeia bacterium]|nr:MotA/TolQ/ExbB proton channel family protein [Candidatus Sumerlaeia bacterium]